MYCKPIKIVKDTIKAYINLLTTKLIQSYRVFISAQGLFKIWFKHVVMTIKLHKLFTIANIKTYRFQGYSVSKIMRNQHLQLKMKANFLTFKVEFNMYMKKIIKLH